MTWLMSNALDIIPTQIKTREFSYIMIRSIESNIILFWKLWTKMIPMQM